MTRLRQIAMAGLAAIAIGGVASSASAMETGTFQNRLNGATIGLPLGAVPPPGLYTGLDTAYLGMVAGSSAARDHVTGNQGGLVLRRSPKRCPCFGCRAGVSGAPPTRPRSSKRSTSSRRAAATAAGCNCNGTDPISAAASSTPTPSSSRSTCRGTWAAAGSCRPPSPSRRRPVRATTGTPNPDYWTFEPSSGLLLPGQQLGGVGELLL